MQLKIVIVLLADKALPLQIMVLLLVEIARVSENNECAIGDGASATTADGIFNGF